MKSLPLSRWVSRQIDRNMSFQHCKRSRQLGAFLHAMLVDLSWNSTTLLQIFRCVKVRRVSTKVQHFYSVKACYFCRVKCVWKAEKFVQSATFSSSLQKRTASKKKTTIWSMCSLYVQRRWHGWKTWTTAERILPDVGERWYLFLVLEFVLAYFWHSESQNVNNSSA
jgi:hypothetical protein